MPRPSAYFTVEKGYALIDTGCSFAFIGEETLRALRGRIITVTDGALDVLPWGELKPATVSGAGLTKWRRPSAKWRGCSSTMGCP